MRKSGDNDDVELYRESSLHGLPTPVMRSDLLEMSCHESRIHSIRCSAVICDNVILIRCQRMRLKAIGGSVFLPLPERVFYLHRENTPLCVLAGHGKDTRDALNTLH